MARPQVQQVLKREGLAGDTTLMTPQQRSARSRIVGFADFDLVHVERWRELQGGGVYYNSNVDDAVGQSLPAAYDITETWRAFPVPIDVIQGDQDYVDPAASAWTSTPAKVHVMSESSHIPWVDNFCAFEAALRASLIRTR